MCLRYCFFFFNPKQREKLTYSPLTLLEALAYLLKRISLVGQVTHSDILIPLLYQSFHQWNLSLRYLSREIP